MRSLVLAAVCLFASAPTIGGEIPSRVDDNRDCTTCLTTEFDRLVALLGDDVLRDMVCRLSSERYTPGKLSSAMGIPEGQILRRIKTLRGWGVVRAVRRDSATTIIEPLPGDGTRTLRRWARRYCPTGDRCGRPRGGPEAGDGRKPSDSEGGAAVAPGGRVAFDPKYAAARDRLMTQIEEEMRETEVYTGRSRLSVPVFKTMSDTPRHEFVPPDLRDRAYYNGPLSIGDGQTISQPYIVALMTEILDLKTSDVALDVGTGSGYQAAVLAPLAAKVFSVEIIESLYLSATERLKRLGYDNVQTRLGDGYEGWPEKGPFDAIVVAAAAERIPRPLVRQLAKGGRMAIVIGEEHEVQQLVLVTKDTDGKVSSRNVLPVRFVPLTGDH